MKIYAILLILTVLVAGCMSQTAKTYSVSIISPSDGQNIQGNSVNIELSTDIKLVPAGGESKEGEGHFHIYLDGTNEQIVDKTSFKFDGVTPGVHTVRAELHKNDHSPYEGVVKSVTFTVGTSAATIAAKSFDITAKQFSFDPNKIEVNQGDVVILKIKSMDVVHGFAIPDFGISQKLEPGKEAVVQFTADKKGTYTFFCNMVCGAGHSGMTGTLVVK